MIPAENKVKRLPLVNHTTKTNHHHPHHHHKPRCNDAVATEIYKENLC